MQLISPKYQMELIDKINKKIFETYQTYKRVELYIDKWHVVDWNYENFSKIRKKDTDVIDLEVTLHNIDGETLMKIAIDLGLDTPDFIPSIPMFRNELKSNYKNSHETFQKALQDIEEHPDIAIALANSALESIIKEILKDDALSKKLDSRKTLYDLTSDILKEFKLFPNSDMPEEIKKIGSSILNINQNIERLRSTKTKVHGSEQESYLIKDSLYAYFIVNSVATVGLFLNSFYRAKYPDLQLLTIGDSANNISF